MAPKVQSLFWLFGGTIDPFAPKNEIAAIQGTSEEFLFLTSVLLLLLNFQKCLVNVTVWNFNKIALDPPMGYERTTPTVSGNFAIL